MSDGYLDSISSLPLRAHTNKGLTGLKVATQIMSIKEIEDKDDLCSKEKEKLDSTSPYLRV
jgi:hypothetical protein